MCSLSLRTGHAKIRHYTTYNGIEPAILDLFLSLCAQLSPENISCDGELSAAQVQVRQREILRKWKALETYVGRPVTEDEVYGHDRTRSEEFQAEYMTEINERDGLVVQDGVDEEEQLSSHQNGTLQHVGEKMCVTVETYLDMPRYLDRSDRDLAAAIERVLKPVVAAEKYLSFKVFVGPVKP